MCCTDFAAILFSFFFKRRSREINGGEANEDAAANDETSRGASSTHTSTEGHGMAVSSGCDYEVFLNFRGPDTRAGFVDFLYTNMTNARIRVYKDDKNLPKGEKFAPELLRAIEQSRISIPIFSKGYASSKWCLQELVKMVECQETRGQKILPVFYDVAPSEVRHQTGGYGLAFCSHKMKRRHSKETISQWKATLNAVGAIDGWDLHSKNNRREGEYVNIITQQVFNDLKKASLVVSDNFVGVDHQVDEIMEMIGVWTSETRIIGICGIGGIGKTTIAKIVYNQLLERFNSCCFLPNIREMSRTKGIEGLQNRLISDILKMECINIRDSNEGTQIIRTRMCDKEVLILLDDVDDKKHMDALAGNHDWFGKGSKLIITARNKEVIRPVDKIYEVCSMNPNQSLQLFSKHAFRRDYPLVEYKNQSKRAIDIAQGLPLALELMGSLLSCIEKEKWDSKLDMLESIPHENVRRILKISYDELGVQEQHVFLDIACLLIGDDKDIMVHLWESKFHPKYIMHVLENLSLIKIKEDNEVWMHDQLRDFGRHIVHEQMNINKQSRVWDPKEAMELLRRQEGKKEVEALCLYLSCQQQHHFTVEDFENLSNLKFLKIITFNGTFHAEERLFWHESPSNVLPTSVLRENLNLLPRLRWLSWFDIPPTFKITNFSMQDVVILDLSCSIITHDWKGWSHIEVMKNLKILNLSYCGALERIPNFSAHPNLERLILAFCTSLIEIDISICHLKRLVSLDVSNCHHLQRLPEVLGGDLAKLEYLSLNNCGLLERLPDSIGNLESLIELHISNINDEITELPDSIRNLQNLKVVKMLASGIEIIPEALWTIKKLEEIEFRSYTLGGIEVKISDCIYRNQSLRILRLWNVFMKALPRLPESLITLELDEIFMDTFPDLSNLTNLKVLSLHFKCTYKGPMEVSMPQWIGNLSNLESLDLCTNRMTTSPTDLALLPRLKSLRFQCYTLRHLLRLPSSLYSLKLECSSLCLMEDLSNLKKLSSLHISSSAITEIQGFGCLVNLLDLELCRLEQVKVLSDLTIFNKLRSLEVKLCPNLVEIQGELPESLQTLHIFRCNSLWNLPNLSKLNGLREVRIHGCMKLNVEAISMLCSEKSIMFRQSMYF